MTTTSEQLLALASRVEAATAPDRELDALVECAHRGREFILLATGDEAYGDICDPGDAGYGTSNKCTSGFCYARFPVDDRGVLGGGRRGNAVQGFTPRAYTASLDAAMTLVPEGCRWAMRSAIAGEKNKKARPYFAHIESRNFKSVTWGRGENWITDIMRGWEVNVFAATPALALTAAALRAAANMEGE